MGTKRRGAAVQSTPAKRVHLDDAEDDGDQDISDDGVQPTGGNDESDDGDSDGDEDEPMEGAEDSDKAEKPTRHSGPASAWKAPTTEELGQLKEANELFKSSAFKFKIDALLPEIRPKASHIPPLDAFLHALHTHLANLSSLKPLHPLEASKTLAAKGVTVPYPSPRPTQDTNWKVAFEKPENVQVVGSWGNKMAVIANDGQGFNVDLALEMPDSLFQEKDYLNARFFHKRAYYLSVIAASLSGAQSKLPMDLSWESPEDNLRRTVLVLRPRKGAGKYDFSKLKASIRLIPTLSPSCPIPIARLSPTHSNIRVTPSDPTTSTSSQTSPPTPIYNADLLRHFTPLPHLLSTYTLSNTVPSFSSALALLRVWANQRSFSRSRSPNLTLSGFEALPGTFWAHVLALLVLGEQDAGRGLKRKRRKTIGRGLSSYQMFRAAMDFLAGHDFEKEAVYLKTDGGHVYEPEEWTGGDATGAVFVDGTGKLNLLAGVSLVSLQLLRQDARLTLQALDITSGDPFESVFMKDIRDIELRFDVVVRIDISRAKFTGNSADRGSRTSALMDAITKTVRQALGTRATLVSLFHPSSTPFPLPATSLTTPASFVSIGILIDPEHATRLVDHGPNAGDEDGTQVFRAFWGPKSELRRFKDGSITESVVWDIQGTGPDERARIPGRVVKYIVEQHFGVPDEDMRVFQDGYEDVLALQSGVPEQVCGSNANAPVGGNPRLVMTAFDTLVKLIKANEALPISLVTAQPVSESLRYTSVFPPMPLSLDGFSSLPDSLKYIPAADVVLQFEKSTKWPDDLAAIQKIKLAFFEAVAQGLPEGTRTYISLDAGKNKVEDNSSLEILTTDGFAFRARIYHDREQTLLERIIADKATPEFKKKEANQALALHRSRFVDAPAHHAAVHALHHRHASYSQTTRLFKRWLAAHCVLPHISNELVELLSASVFLDPGVYPMPNSGAVGFARILALLVEWDWRERPLFVPIYAAAGLDAQDTKSVSFSPQKKKESEELFGKARASDPGASKGAWAVVTEEDAEGRRWSASLGVVVAGRIKQLAKATLGCLRVGVQSGDLDVKAMFDHPTNDYDFLIHLDPTVLPRYSQNVRADDKVWSRTHKYANLAMSEDDLPLSLYGSTPKVDFDPALLFFRDLERVYGDNMMLFYDPYGGAIIAGSWNPLLLKSRPFRVFVGFSSAPEGGSENSKKPMVTINQAAILAEIRRHGQGLVKDITTRS